MESTTPPQNPDDARSLLDAAGSTSRQLTAGLRLPVGLIPLLGAAVALQIGTAAYGIARQTTAGLAVLLGGLGVLLLVGVVALHRFRRTNGVRVDGLAGRLLLGTGTTASSAYLGGLVVAVWAAFASAWWGVGLAAVAGGAGYALGTARWWQAYRRDPVAHASGASPWTLAALAGLAALGLAALLAVG